MSDSNVFSTVIGNVVVLTSTITGPSGLVDPTTVVLRIKPPDDIVLVLTPTNDSVGVYSYLFTPTQVGMHYFRFEGTGVAVFAEQHQFLVTASLT